MKRSKVLFILFFVFNANMQIAALDQEAVLPVGKHNQQIQGDLGLGSKLNDENSVEGDFEDKAIDDSQFGDEVVEDDEQEGDADDSDENLRNTPPSAFGAWVISKLSPLALWWLWIKSFFTTQSQDTQEPTAKKLNRKCRHPHHFHQPCVYE